MVDFTDGELHISPEPMEIAMPISFQAALIIVCSALLGVLGNMLFYRAGLGINVLVFSLAILFVGGALHVYVGSAQPHRNVLFVFPLLLSAGFIGVRSSGLLLLVNSFVMMGTAFVVLRFSWYPHLLGGSLTRLVLVGFRTVNFAGLLEPLNTFPESRVWFKHLYKTYQPLNKFGAVLRGVVLTGLIMSVFGLLLASADIVFSDYLTNALRWLQPDVVAIGEQYLVTGFFTWLCLICLRVSLLNRNGGEIVDTPEEFQAELSVRLTMIETSMILTGVSLLFLVFIGIQARYLFGGEANISVQGYTYAEYARRGFYEILAVSVMVVGLIISLDLFTHRKREREYTFRSLSIGLVLLTLLLLVAAFQRMLLYEDAFGFTRRRVLTQVFMVWLGFIFLFLIRDIVSRRNRLFWVGSIFAGLGFVFTLNVMNMDAFIAARNIDRFMKTGKLDAEYLAELSDDAIPVIAPLLENEKLDQNRRNILVNELRMRLYDFDRKQQDNSVFEFHFGKSRAHAVLEDYRDLLNGYNSSNAE